MLIPQYKLVFVLCLILTLCFGCSKKEEKQQQQVSEESEEYEYSVSGGIEGQVQRSNINYDSLFAVVDELTKKIINNPTNIELRKKIVATCYDTINNIIISSGHGKPLTSASTKKIAKNYAHKAAEIDAYRWAAYIKKWKLDPTKPDLGKIDDKIPSGDVVSKLVLPDSTVQVLVEVKVEK